MSSSVRENQVVVDVRGVRKFFPVKLNAPRLLGYLMPWQRPPRQGDYWALKGVDLTVSKGEVVGLIGRNGSGKSTLLQIIAGLMSKSGGDVKVHGRVTALLELGAGFNPEFTGRENIYLSGAIYGLDRRAIRERFDDIVEFADIGEYLDQPVKTYSSGMFARLAFSVSIQVDPDIILVDEILSVGDVAFQSKCYRKIEELRDAGSAIILVTHDLNSVQMFCDRAYLLHNGEILCAGSPNEVANRYIYLLMEMESNYQSTSRCPGLPDSSRVAYIDDVQLLDENGKVTTKPRSGQRCTAVYVVHFNEDIDQPIVTFQLKTLLGVVVSDVSSAYQTISMPRCRAGAVLQVSVDFRLNLCPGPYRLGVSLAQRMQAGDVPVFGTEQATIEVICDGKPRAYGITHIDPEMKLDLI